jgi:hypothetical protein
MTKEKKTARELAELIAEEMSAGGGIRINVHTNPSGWHATGYGWSPNRAAQAQAEVDQIVQRLRATYDLDDSRS